MKNSPVYEKDLDLLLDIARTEYRMLSTDDERLQLGYMRTYLALAAFLSAGLPFIGFPLTSGGPEVVPFLLWGASCLLAGSAFLYGVRLLRGDGAPLCFGKFQQMLGIVERASLAGDDRLFRYSLLRFLDRAVTERTELVNRRGEHLRRLSRLLSASALTAFLAVGACVLRRFF